MTDRELKLEDALTQILQWCMAYPHTMFRPVTDEQLTSAAVVLRGVGIDIGALHAEWARHLLDGIGKIAKEGLE